MLDPTKINTVDRNQKERQRELQGAKEARLAELESKKRVKKKTRGRSKIGRRLAKKESNIMDEKRMKRQEELEQYRKKQRERQRAGPSNEPTGYDPLARFGDGS